tara:strand:- start:580 stop:1719 length:1140 start_codon:yes stop_codon:yes gene_type:complete
MPDYNGVELAYYNSLKVALEDGSIDSKEFTHLKELREQLSISMEMHNQMESKLREETKPQTNSDDKTSLGIKDSVISKSKITNVAGDSITHQYSSGDVENYAKMMVDFVSRGKIVEANETWEKAHEVNFEQTKEIFQNKYGQQIETAYLNHIKNITLPTMRTYLKQYEDAVLIATAIPIYHQLVEVMEVNITCCLNAIDVLPRSASLRNIYAQSFYEYNKNVTSSDQVRPNTFKSGMRKAKEQNSIALKLQPNDPEIIALSEKIMNVKQVNRGCFITTATVNHMGELDNGQTLNTLRHFRDTIMNKTPEGRKQIRWYYANAPQIVTHLDNLKNKEEVYTKLYNGFILPAAKAYRKQQSDIAFNLYKEGLLFAIKKIESS